MSPGCVQLPKNRCVALPYDFPSFPHPLLTFLVAMTTYPTKGNLGEGKVYFGSQSVVTQSIMADHITCTHRKPSISRKWGRATKPPVTDSLQQDSTSWRLHSLPEQCHQLRSECPNTQAFERHFMFKPQHANVCLPTLTPSEPGDCYSTEELIFWGSVWGCCYCFCWCWCYCCYVVIVVVVVF